MLIRVRMKHRSVGGLLCYDIFARLCDNALLSGRIIPQMQRPPEMLTYHPLHWRGMLDQPLIAYITSKNGT